MASPDRRHVEGLQHLHPERGDLHVLPESKLFASLTTAQRFEYRGGQPSIFRSPLDRALNLSYLSERSRCPKQVVFDVWIEENVLLFPVPYPDLEIEIHTDALTKVDVQAGKKLPFLIGEVHQLGQVPPGQGADTVPLPVIAGDPEFLVPFPEHLLRRWLTVQLSLLAQVPHHLCMSPDSFSEFSPYVFIHDDQGLQLPVYF